VIAGLEENRSLDCRRSASRRIGCDYETIRQASHEKGGVFIFM
jgi:hypothetical protein